jgi:hypothetical protein
MTKNKKQNREQKKEGKKTILGKKKRGLFSLSKLQTCI